MVDKSQDNKQVEGNILNDKADILRARDIIPSADSSGQEKSQIPTFDLAKNIMARQREINAVRRTSPGQKIPAKLEPLHPKPLGRNINRPVQQIAKTSQIIKEIVARDIERLCRAAAR